MTDAERVEQRKLIDVCPICGSEMEKGYIASRIISWSDKKISNWSPKGLFGGEMIVSRGYPYLFANVEAYRCKRDKLVIFKYAESDNSRGDSR